MERRNIFILRNISFIFLIFSTLYLMLYNSKYGGLIENDKTEKYEDNSYKKHEENSYKKHEENNERIATVQRVCGKILRNLREKTVPVFSSQYSLQSVESPPGLDMIKIDKRHKIAICVPFKAGSETWRYLLSSTTQEEGSKGNHSETENVKILSLLEVESFSKAIQVRDPYERLLSAYRFTFENGNSLKHSNDLTKVLLKAYPQLPKAQDKNGGPTVSFPQFIQSIVSGMTDLSPSLGPQTSRKLLTEGAALHWLPYYQQCNPCHPMYTPDHIIKLDTWLDDTYKFLKERRISTKRTFFLLNAAPDGHSSDPDLLKRYFSQVEKSVLHQLSKMYELDFQLFGYNPESIFHLLNAI